MEDQWEVMEEAGGGEMLVLTKALSGRKGAKEEQ